MTKHRLGIAGILRAAVGVFFRHGRPILLMCIPATILSALLLQSLDWGTDALLIGYLTLRYCAWLVTAAFLHGTITYLCVTLAVNRTGDTATRWQVVAANAPTTITRLAIILLLSSVANHATLLMPAPVRMIGSLVVLVAMIYINVCAVAISQVVVVEATGLWRGFRRSLDLTAGYRWPIAGLTVLTFVAILLVWFPSKRILPMQYSDWYTAASTCLWRAFSAILGTLIYLRLRQIKDGTALQDLADIFA